MGLIKWVLLFPVAPLRFTTWVADKVAEEADHQEFSSQAGVRKLAAIEEARERGELDEEEAAELEGVIIEQLMARLEPTAPEESAENG